ncbi:MAG: hypothetical protein KGJ23_11375 [Euryarchaeota archaeon]|nr:hypothetical protein [Euryarchaeota archaeon]MDE1837195.1 hypothetical protein [Euryarchaeota archaeon]MDE1882081.1 hypothetical protein [Euryarchaeota archaeon]MDE2045351.1 hypothetical protein [Thermoplasmata archaeon]
MSVAPQDTCPRADEASPVGTGCGRCRGLHNGPGPIAGPERTPRQGPASERPLPPAPRFHPVHVEDAEELLAAPHDWMSEVRARELAVMPGSDYDDG